MIATTSRTNRAAAPSWVRVQATFAANAPTSQVSPRTHCVVDSNRFLPATQPGSELYDGALDLRGIDQTRLPAAIRPVDMPAIVELLAADGVRPLWH